MDDELILPGMSEREIAIRRRVHRLAEFYRHVFVYVIVNLTLWGAVAEKQEAQAWRVEIDVETPDGTLDTLVLIVSVPGR